MPSHYSYDYGDGTSWRWYPSQNKMVMAIVVRMNDKRSHFIGKDITTELSGALARPHTGT